MSGQRLKEDMHVEVTTDEDGLRGAWYVAKIIEAPKSEDRYVVEFNEFVNEDDESKKLIESVHVSYVRPLPPVGKGINEVIEVNDVVDAFYNDGWWTGWVHDVVDEGKKFVVCFDDPPDKMVCKRSDVRVHFDWVLGQWVKPQKKDSSRHSMLSNHSGNSKRQKRRAKKQQAEKGCTSTEDKDHTGVPDEIIEKECTAEVDMSVKEVEGALSAKNCETLWKKDQKNKSRDQVLHAIDSTNVSTKGDNGLKRKRGRPKLLSKKQIGEGSTGAKSSLRKTIKKYSCVGDEAEISAEKHSLMLTTIDKPNEDHFQSSSKDSMMVTADKKSTSGAHRHNDLLSETAIIHLLEDQADETVLIKRVKRRKNSLSNAHNNDMSKIVDSESRYQGCDNASRGDSSLHEIYHAKDADMLIDEIPVNPNNDQVSNSRIQLDKPSPKGTNESRTLPVQHQCADANGMQDDFGTPAAKKDRMEPCPLQKTDDPRDLPVKSLNRADSNDKDGELGTPFASVCVDNVENDQGLPFVKGSPLWKTIESMEIFKKTKKPHFSPLVKCKEETREGLAIGHMVNFSNLVGNISKLQFRHPITVIESELEILVELESHGFDVETIRACLTQLLLKKKREGELQKEYKDIEKKISNSVKELSKVDEEITELNQKIRELAAKLGDAVSRKEMKESVISTLQSKQDVAGENVQRLQIDFKNIAGALL